MDVEESGRDPAKYYYRGTCLSDSRKQTKSLNQCQSWCPDGDSNSELTRHRTETLPLELATGKENVKLFLCLIQGHAMTTYGGVEIQRQAIFISVLYMDESSAS
jgi:hypothetical protein